jgi:F-type H+-transporting ATPase subunit delta
MSDAKISKRYAKALFEFAQEQKSMDSIKADMDYLYQLCEVSDDFVSMLKSPVIKISKKLEIMVAIFGDKLSETTMKFLNIISKSRREDIIPSMAEQFVLMHNDFIGLKKVKLFTATSLDNTTKEQITKILGEQTKKTIELDEEIQEDLIGGFILKIDDLQFDASIKSKLNRLKNELSQQY